MDIVKQAFDALTASRALIGLGRFTTGYCCCGDTVDSHGMETGHGPIDEGDYHMQGVIEQIDAALLAITNARSQEPAR